MRHSTLAAAYAITAACAPTRQPAPIAAVARPNATLAAPSVSAPEPPAAAAAPTLSRVPTSNASTPQSTVSSAEADVNLDLRAWPTNVSVDAERESVYEAAKFRDGIPRGAKVRVYPKESYGFVARFDADREQDAFTQC